MTRKEQRLRRLIAQTRGRFFRLVFIKCDGEHRQMVARIGVHKGIKGKGLAYNPLKKRIRIVYDVQRHGFKAVRLDRVLLLKCGKVVYEERTK